MTTRTVNGLNPEAIAAAKHAARYAGMMGHEFVVVGYYPEDDNWETCSEVNTLEQAEKAARERKRPCIVLQRSQGPDKWEAVLSTVRTPA